MTVGSTLTTPLLPTRPPYGTSHPTFFVTHPKGQLLTDGYQREPVLVEDRNVVRVVLIKGIPGGYRSIPPAATVTLVTRLINNKESVEHTSGTLAHSTTKLETSLANMTDATLHDLSSTT